MVVAFFGCERFCDGGGELGELWKVPDFVAGGGCGLAEGVDDGGEGGVWVVGTCVEFGDEDFELGFVVVLFRRKELFPDLGGCECAAFDGTAEVVQGPPGSAADGDEGDEDGGDGGFDPAPAGVHAGGEFRIVVPDVIEEVEELLCGMDVVADEVHLADARAVEGLGAAALGLECGGFRVVRCREIEQVEWGVLGEFRRGEEDPGDEAAFGGVEEFELGVGDFAEFRDGVGRFAAVGVSDELDDSGAGFDLLAEPLEEVAVAGGELVLIDGCVSDLAEFLGDGLPDLAEFV